MTMRLSALRREQSAAQYLPYTALLTEHVVQTVAGDLVQVFRLGGASFESADDEALNAWHERLNLLWRNVASPNVALWVHLIRRRRTLPVPDSQGAGFAANLEAAYRRRLSTATLMVNEWYLSIVYRPVVGAAPSLLARAARRSPRGTALEERGEALEACEKLAGTLAAALEGYEPERLGVYQAGIQVYSRLLEFLALLVNGEQAAVPLPYAPLREVLATARLLFGTEAMEYRQATGTRVAAMLSIKEYPTPTRVGMFDTLLSAPFPFVLTQSFTFLGKATAQGLLQRQHARMGNAGDFAVSQAEELIDALDALTGNEFVMGDHHFTLQILAEPDETRAADPAWRLRHLNDAVARARSLLADSGMTVAREDLALEAAFWAQLPGNFAYRPRKAPITSRNFAAMANFHNYPAGRATGNHWGEALAPLVTSARSAYHFSLHASDPNDPTGGSRTDTGHSFVCGPTGSGKTVLIGFLASLLARRDATQVFFDRDRGLEILVRALGGRYLAIKTGVPTSFNPLQVPDGAASTDFLRLWLRLLAGPAPLSVREEADLDQALHGTLSLPIGQRRLSRLIEFTDASRPEGLHARLAPWCASERGDYAWVFDNSIDALSERLAGCPLIGFDVTDFLDHPRIRSSVTLYLFHCVRSLLDGRRFVLWADEFSRLLDDAAFGAFAKEGLKVWRKLNGVFCAATQSPSDALASPISRTIIEQTATKVFFPNPEANATEYMEGFALTEREFQLVKERLPPGARSFLVKQGHASVVCELDLKGFDGELAVISGRSSSLARLERIEQEVGSDLSDWLPRFMGEAAGK